jgi:hypothetical protein
MLRATAVILLVGFISLTINCSPRITPDETNALAALEGVRRGVEANIEYEQFIQLLEKAGAAVKNLKQQDTNSSCFLNSVDKCFSAYEIAAKAWKRRLDETDEKKKADMNMTLAFSLSFASLHIKKANDCFK